MCVCAWEREREREGANFGRKRAPSRVMEFMNDIEFSNKVFSPATLEVS